MTNVKFGKAGMLASLRLKNGAVLVGIIVLKYAKRSACKIWNEGNYRFFGKKFSFVDAIVLLRCIKNSEINSNKLGATLTVCYSKANRLKRNALINSTLLFLEFRGKTINFIVDKFNIHFSKIAKKCVKYG